MTLGRRVGIWVAVIVILPGIALVAIRAVHAWKRHRVIYVLGAVFQQNSDARKEAPIAGADITAATGLGTSACRSDATGYFRLPLPPGIRKGQPVRLLFVHPGFRPLVMDQPASGEICLARMLPLPHEIISAREVVVANLRVRYSVNSTTMENVGSAVRTFEVENAGNVPCKGRKPCSPNGTWKAGVTSVTEDAGPGNEFWDLRVSCIAGPCPFTRIVSTRFSQASRMVTVQALDWSDTATFLLQAEVIRLMVRDVVRETYPVIFGDALNFTVPGTAEGVSLEAELDGDPIVFPLGPTNILTWADCSVSTNSDRTKLYRCSLLPGYRFP